MKKLTKRRMAAVVILTLAMTFILTTTAYANAVIRPPTVQTWNQGQVGNVVRGNNIHGLNAPGRPNAINTNDFHTEIWQRFLFNYTFTSGPDFRYVLGRPTYVSASQVRRDQSTQNIRRDRHVSFMPLPYGIFSAIVDTYIANPFFATWVNEHGGLPYVLENPNVIENFDTLMLGVNNLDWQNPNPLNMFYVGYGQEGFLPPTSVGVSY